MVSTEKEKRKNDMRPRFQWWLLIIGFALGVVAMLAVSQINSPPPAPAQAIPADIAQTATAIIIGATGTAERVFAITPAADTELDPILATATVIIQQATQQAAMTPASP